MPLAKQLLLLVAASAVAAMPESNASFPTPPFRSNKPGAGSVAVGEEPPEEVDAQARFDMGGGGGGTYEVRAPPSSVNTRFTIQNVFSGEYLYVDDAKGVADAVVQTGTIDAIRARASSHALFHLAWNEDLDVQIVCVDNGVLLVGTFAPQVEQHPVAPVVASLAPSAASLWSIGDIAWEADVVETMFIINHKYTDFLFAIGDPSRKKPALTTRHVKYYGLARARWIIRPYQD